MATQEEMNSSHSSLWKLLFATLLLVTGPTASAQVQQSNIPSLNYGFVSPNTRDDLKLAEAVRGMSSTEESDLLTNARNLGCVVKSKITTFRALGSWTDGAEHSMLLRVQTDESTIRYLVSRLGRDANQKAVIYFHPASGGSAKIHVVYIRPRSRSFATISDILDKAGIAFRTLVPTKRNTIVYMVDTDNTLATKVKMAVKKLHARFISQTGTASFIGDDADRQKSQTIFTKEIIDYETAHPNLPPPCAVK